MIPNILLLRWHTFQTYFDLQWGIWHLPWHHFICFAVLSNIQYTMQSKWCFLRLLNCIMLIKGICGERLNCLCGLYGLSQSFHPSVTFIVIKHLMTNSLLNYSFASALFSIRFIAMEWYPWDWGNHLILNALLLMYDSWEHSLQIKGTIFQYFSCRKNMCYCHLCGLE